MRPPGLRSPSGPNMRPLTSSWSTKSQACGCCWLSRPNSLKYWPAFPCRVPRGRRLQPIRFSELDRRLVVLVELEDDVRHALEVRVDRAVEEDLRVGHRETALVGVVVAELERAYVRGGRPAEVEQRVE